MISLEYDLPELTLQIDLQEDLRTWQPSWTGWDVDDLIDKAIYRSRVRYKVISVDKGVSRQKLKSALPDRTGNQTFDEYLRFSAYQ